MSKRTGVAGAGKTESDLTMHLNWPRSGLSGASFAESDATDGEELRGGVSRPAAASSACETECARVRDRERAR